MVACVRFSVWGIWSWDIWGRGLAEYSSLGCRGGGCCHRSWFWGGDLSFCQGWREFAMLLLLLLPLLLLLLLLCCRGLNCLTFGRCGAADCTPWSMLAFVSARLCQMRQSSALQYSTFCALFLPFSSSQHPWLRLSGPISLDTIAVTPHIAQYLLSSLSTHPKRPKRMRYSPCGGGAVCQIWGPSL